MGHHPADGHEHTGRTVRRGALAAELRGRGPTVVLVHGVGLGPETFAALAEDLATGATVVTVRRPGYGRPRPGPSAAPGVGAPTVDLDQQVTDLADLVEGLGLAPAVLVGVSGGATLGLLACLARPDLFGAAILHEPLVGPLAPALHERLLDRAAALAADPDPVAPQRFVAGLVGDATWQRLPSAWRGDVARVAPVVRAEVPAFCRVAPTVDELVARRGRPPVLVTTVGGSSGTARRQAAGVLVDRAGARAHTLAGVGHLAQVEAPAVLARHVRHLLPAPVGSAP